MTTYENPPPTYSCDTSNPEQSTMTTYEDPPSTYSCDMVTDTLVVASTETELKNRLYSALLTLCIPQLKVLCEAMKQKKTGNKDEIVERLVFAMFRKYDETETELRLYKAMLNFWHMRLSVLCQVMNVSVTGSKKQVVKRLVKAMLVYSDEQDTM